MSKIKARVLAAFPDGDKTLPVGCIVLAVEKTIAALETAGLVDSNADAVSYAESQGGESFDLSGGEFDQSVQSRIDENKDKIKEVKKLTEKQATAAIGKMSAAEKKAFDDSGLDIDAWLTQEADQIISLVASAQKSLDDAEKIAAFIDAEKLAFEQSGLSLDEWLNLADEDRKARINAMPATPN